MRSESATPEQEIDTEENQAHRERRKRRRERIAIVLLSVLFVLLTIGEIQLTKLSSTLPFVNSIFFFGLLNINIILLIAIFWLIFRNISRLFIERRRKILGARLKSKLVVAFLAFAITPTLVLFTISSLYINSSFDKWFSLKVQNTLQSSLEITRNYYKNSKSNGLHFAQHISSQLSQNFSDRLASQEKLQKFTLFEDNQNWIQSYLNEQRNLLALDAIEFYFDPFEQRVATYASRPDGGFYPRLPYDLLEKAFQGESVPVIQHIGTGDLIRTLVPVIYEKAQIGILVVSSYIPISLVNKVDEIASVFDDYRESNPLKYPVKTAYFVILIMMTLVIIFVAIWIGLHLAREMTVPIERLVRGAEQVGGGNLEVSVEKTGEDEISTLIDSFNQMTKDLKENRVQLTTATQDLEKRKTQLETILGTIGAGVIVIDKSGKITNFNRAVSQLLKMRPKNAIGKDYEEILEPKSVHLVELVEKAPASSQFSLKIGSQTATIAGITSPLYDGKAQWGTALVIDDISNLIKAQREVAWREVARRIAHEIKNPLTPIKLSAQRLRRRFNHYAGREQEILSECTETIIKHTDELKDLVNEFSNFARLPEVSPSPNNINQAIQEIVTLFSQAHPHILFQFRPDLTLPVFSFDRDQIKRVMMNLFDNAVSAMKAVSSDQAHRVEIQTSFNQKLKLVSIEMKDNGPGMPEHIKSRVFEPYFSTKNEGTGLGLAIAKRIINDHNGFIRVDSQIDIGTQFQIEIPIGTDYQTHPEQTKRSLTAET